MREFSFVSIVLRVMFVTFHVVENLRVAASNFFLTRMPRLNQLSLINLQMEERLRKNRNKILHTKTGSGVPMKVSFNK